TQTSPRGRKAQTDGYPFHLCEMLAVSEGSAYIARVALTNPRLIKKAKEAIRKAFLTQIEEQGFSLVEILSPCPTNWGLPPLEAVKWLEEHLMATYRIGEIKVKEGVTNAC
ncbi:MAG: 2-oxoglutarate oxidoreductase, partial [Atribacterota bacterium]